MCESCRRNTRSRLCGCCHRNLGCCTRIWCRFVHCMLGPHMVPQISKLTFCRPLRPFLSSPTISWHYLIARHFTTVGPSSLSKPWALSYGWSALRCCRDGRLITVEDHPRVTDSGMLHFGLKLLDSRAVPRGAATGRSESHSRAQLLG